MSAPPVLSAPMASALRCLVIDQVTVEVVEALAGAGIDCLLLKGPSIANWLYPEGGRSYLDTDLLVPPASFEAARALLGDIGFQDYQAGWSDRERPTHAVTYWRAGRGGGPYFVDLHRSLPAVQASPSMLWEALWSGSEEMTLAGHGLRILGTPARAMHLGLHAAQHGSDLEAGADHPLQDLERALRLLTPQVWAQAAALAARLGAGDAFATGLRLTPRGSRLAAELGLVATARPAVRLAARAHPRGTKAVLALSEAGSVREATLILARGLFPSRAAIRLSDPLARRGGLALIAAYASRLGRIALGLGPALVVWRQVRREP